MQFNQDISKLTHTATSRKAVNDCKSAIETQKQVCSAKGENKNSQADEKLPKSTGSGWPGGEVKDLLHDAVARLFKDAGVEYGRVSARGQQYSIADDAYSEYVYWFDMPWE